MSYPLCRATQGKLHLRPLARATLGYLCSVSWFTGVETIGQTVYVYRDKHLDNISKLEYEKLQRDDEDILLYITANLDKILWPH